jgi:hypothetical protein
LIFNFLKNIFFQVRNLELRHCESDSIRVITQYHYLTWPDFGVPHSTSTFLKFLHAVSSKHPSTSDSPNIIHCSAGIGRSGNIFFLILYISNKKSKFRRYLTKLCRPWLQSCGMIWWKIINFGQMHFEFGSPVWILLYFWGNRCHKTIYLYNILYEKCKYLFFKSLFDVKNTFNVGS